tara:strand:+ start:624 stop:998 length:375 start_codon:yes stop_codon:yes gene_type:complete
MKYKNKDGIELNFTSNDIQSELTKEVISEAIKILTKYNRMDARSAEWALSRGVNFLKENFDIEEDYPYNTEFGNGRTKEEMEAIDNRNEDEWRIKQYNRNRDAKDQVSTIEELDKRISDEVFNS